MNSNCVSMAAFGLTVLSLAGSTVFAADADPMANFYANTMVSKHEDGGLYSVYFNRNHTYRVTHDGKEVKAGTYTYENGKLCMHDKDKSVECPPFRADLKVGETWDAVTASGKHDWLTLQAGRKP